MIPPAVIRSTTMKAFGLMDQYKPLGDLSALKEYKVPKPTAITGTDLLVKVKAIATNPIDYKKLGNLGEHKAKFEGEEPLVVGWDVSGIVEAVGEDSSLFQVGDEVFFAGDFFRPGAFAEYVLVDERIVGTKPSSLSWSQAAAEPLTALTAYEAMLDQLKIPLDPKANAGKTILITGGAGGVASAAYQIAKNVLGLTVIGTGSRPETVNYVQDVAGVDLVVNHRKPYGPQLKKLGITEVDYVFHTSDLSNELFTEFTEIVKPFGGIVSIWPSASPDLMQLFWKSINFSAVLMFTRPPLKNEASMRQHDLLELHSKLLDEGVLKTRENVSMKLTIDNLRQALEAQASGKAIGKTTLHF